MPATETDLPYAGLLRRRPAQARSAARVEAILEAAARQIAGGGLDALTIRATAAGAGVPTGTIYQFFGGKEALVQALAVSYVASTPAVAEEALAGDVRSWEEALDATVDAFAAMLRRAPAMRCLWIAGVIDAATGRIAAGADDAIADRLRDRLATLAGTPGSGSSADWRFLVTLVGDILHRAFRHDPVGDHEVLSRGKLVVRLYARELL